MVSAINGETDNQQLGSDLTQIGTVQGAVSVVHIGSNSGGAINQRQYYSNIMRIATLNKNST